MVWNSEEIQLQQLQQSVPILEGFEQKIIFDSRDELNTYMEAHVGKSAVYIFHNKCLTFNIPLFGDSDEIQKAAQVQWPSDDKFDELAKKFILCIA